MTNFFSSLIIDARQIDKFSADLIFVLTVLWFGQLNIGIGSLLIHAAFYTIPNWRLAYYTRFNYWHDAIHKEFSY